MPRNGDRVALIFCDHQMPGTLGVDFIRMNRFPLRGGPKSALTGQVGHQDTIRAINEAGLDHYVSKPWTQGNSCEVAKEQLTAFVIAQDPEPQRFSDLLDGARIFAHIHEQGLLMARREEKAPGGGPRWVPAAGLLALAALPVVVPTLIDGLDVYQHRMFGIMLAAIVLWISELVPVYATGLLIILLELLLLSDKAPVFLRVGGGAAWLQIDLGQLCVPHCDSLRGLCPGRGGQ